METILYQPTLAKTGREGAHGDDWGKGWLESGTEWMGRAGARATRCLSEPEPEPLDFGP